MYWIPEIHGAKRYSSLFADICYPIAMRMLGLVFVAISTTLLKAVTQ